jgi:hypothetical protein
MSQHYTAGLGCILWQGHKWALSSLFKTLSIRGYDVAKLHQQISKIVVMTILPIVPLLVHNYNTYLSEDDQGRTCFELLGMDVLIDQKCKPWLLEVNHSPSFSIDTPLDLKVKEALITDTLKLVGVSPSYVPCLRLQVKPLRIHSLCMDISSMLRGKSLFVSFFSYLCTIYLSPCFVIVSTGKA